MAIRSVSRVALANGFLCWIVSILCGLSCSDEVQKNPFSAMADADPQEQRDTDRQEPKSDAGFEPDGSAAQRDQGENENQSAEQLLFVIAGQSNAEGNVFHNGLMRLAEAIPTGQNPLNQEERKIARRAVGRSLGSFCGVEEDCIDNPDTCEETPPFTHTTADVVIDSLRASALDWRTFDVNYRHPSVDILAAQYQYAPVVLLDPMNQHVDNEECNASPDQTTTSGPDLNRYTEETWAPLGPGFGALEDPEEGLLFGPELSFGVAIGRPWPNASILKVAMGGSSLGDHWRLDGPLYQTMLDEIQSALTEKGAKLGGLIWFQGFNDQFDDAYCQPLTPDYEARLLNFLQAIRETLGADLPVVIVKARNGGNLGEIQRAQEQVTANLSGAALVESADLSDCFHYDSGAQLIIGERVADAMTSLIENSDENR